MAVPPTLNIPAERRPPQESYGWWAYTFLMAALGRTDLAWLEKLSQFCAYIISLGLSLPVCDGWSGVPTALTYTGKTVSHFTSGSNLPGRQDLGSGNGSS